MLQRIYADNSATTALSLKAFEAMTPLFLNSYGNPSAIHSYGRAANAALEDSRKKVAAALGGLSSEIFFTSGGTESDNWAIYHALKIKGAKKGRILASSIEHSAVLKPLERLREKGYEIDLVAPDKFGRVTAENLSQALGPDVVLASFMAANNVVGTISEIKELSLLARQKGVLFHSDAVQAAG
ncbi:MAG: aminotransferase class V-fold PLP-dependent enzyme, partial [Deltaproteobacteria bacterium]|nr:aminotransferase class V-fold PLP-dependent enzyme [Deltaproteobacteria bacterium]